MYAVLFGSSQVMSSYNSFIDKFGLEKGFLNFLESIFPNLEGVDLFKIKDNGTIQQLSLNENGGLNKKDC